VVGLPPTKDTEYEGMKFKTWANDPDVPSEVLGENCYGIENIPEGGVVIDIGAHIGAFSIYCAVKKSCTVYAFEPGPSFELLMRGCLALLFPMFLIMQVSEEVCFAMFLK